MSSSSNKKTKIFLAGSTGYVGGRLLHRLENAKREVRCLTRSLSSLQRYKNSSHVEIVQGDVLDKKSLLKALDGIDVAFYLVHAMGAKNNFEEIEHQGAKNFGEACEEKGVKRIIYLGGLGERRAKLSPHLRSRHHVGDLLREKAASAQVIEFQASIIIGSGSLSFEMIRALCERLPVMITPLWVWTEAQPIAIDDVLLFLEKAIDIAIEDDPIFEIGGSNRSSYAGIMEEYARQKKYHRFFLPVPVLTPYLSSLWLGLVTPLYARVGRKLVESAIFPTIVTEDRANGVFGVQPMGIEEAIQKAIEQEEKKHWESRWVDSHSAAGIKEKRVSPDKRDLKASLICFVDAPPSQAFAPIKRIGGVSGWYYGNVLWKIRGFLDQLVGGVGFRRMRRDAENIFVGDVVDFWRVEAYEPNKRLRLLAEMKLPGYAWLEFCVEGCSEASWIRQDVIYKPSGFFGTLYWYLLYPFHWFIFRGMLKRIGEAVRREKKEEQKDPLLHTFVHWSRIPAAPEKVFAWHEEPDAFSRLQPPWVKIQEVKRTGPLSSNPRVTLEQTVGLFSFRWELDHENYVAGKEFTDVMMKGPFQEWKHRHHVLPDEEGGSFLIDTITYKIPGGYIGSFLCNRWIERQLRKTFEYRHRSMQKMD